MKRTMLFFEAVLFTAFILTGCAAKNTNDKDNSIKSLQKTDSVVVKKTDNKVTCTECEKTKDGETYTIKECKFRDYKSVKNTFINSTNGHEYYEYKLTKLVGNKEIPIKNIELFNDKRNELLSIINERMRAVINIHYGEEGVSDCLPNDDPNRKFTFDQINITFQEGKFLFNVSLGLPDACAAFDQNDVEISIKDIEKYLK